MSSVDIVKLCRQGKYNQVKYLAGITDSITVNDNYCIKRAC